jgi:hypothetical protein
MKVMTTPKVRSTRKTATATAIAQNAASTTPVKVKLINHKFANGTSAKGTPETLRVIAEAFGESFIIPARVTRKGYYYSESRGKILKISAMNEIHIRNAILHRTNALISGMPGTITNSEFLKMYTSISNDAIVSQLVDELKKR